MLPMYTAWETICMSHMNPNNCLLHVSNLSVLSFLFFSAHVSGVTDGGHAEGGLLATAVSLALGGIGSVDTGVKA